MCLGAATLILQNSGKSAPKRKREDDDDEEPVTKGKRAAKPKSQENFEKLVTEAETDIKVKSSYVN
jgi:hypothetical protein